MGRKRGRHTAHISGGSAGGILDAIVDAWHHLPEAIRAGILAMVKASNR